MSTDIAVRADAVADGAAPPPPPPPPPRRGPARRWLRDAFIVVASVSLGLAVAAMVRSGDDAPAAGAGISLPTPAAPQATADPVADGDGVDDAAVAPAAATTPAAAVTGFLDGEARGDFAASYPFLSAADRATWPSPESWVAAHAQLAPITGFRVGEVDERGGETHVVADLRLRSSLDPVLGLIPARATADWRLVEESGAWRVAFAESVLEPVYPPDADAVAAAAAWARARQSCAAAPEFGGTLFGQPALADALCGATGAVATGDATRLPPAGDSAGLVAAYGAEAIGWARVVPITAPVELAAVLAPVDDGWLVVGVLPPDPQHR